jgi:hypothetical protein
MNFRQVHLDFHTSEHIPNVGAKFSKAQFQAALKTGHVNSVTVFSKCHHGWAYHPSEANEIHPNLTFDLLGAQIEAAHEIGVKTPVYLSAGLDEKAIRRNPEWLMVEYGWTETRAKSFERAGYHQLCMNTPYLDYLLAQIKEVCERYDADGIFLDIVGVRSCCCPSCVKTLFAEGKSPANPRDVKELGERVYANYTRRARETVDSVKPGLPVFHNGGHIRRGRRDLAFMNSHLELESLPTGGWGYDHFPLSAAYARALGMDFLGMTGKFHGTWGEFGGFKHPNALRYEAALSAANGAKCSVGDQLHPSGEMDAATYALIGAAYAELEAAEPWLEGAENIADVGVFTAESAENYYGGGPSRDLQTGLSDAGAARILLEGNYLFNAIDAAEDFSKYKVLVLPDSVRLDGFLTEKFQKFIENGGKILASGESGLCAEKDAFALNFGVEYLGESAFRPDYFRPDFPLKSLENAAFVMYGQGRKIEARGANVLGFRENPYFNRTAARFCSHQHAPANPDAAREAAMTQSDAGIYIAWNVFEDYAENGSLILKELVVRALDLLLGENKTLQTNLPAQGVATLTEQKKEKRKIAHLLYASPVKRGRDVEVIEDILPVYGTEVSVNTESEIKRVYLAPQMEEIPFVQNGGRARFAVEKFVCRQMVVLEA